MTYHKDYFQDTAGIYEDDIKCVAYMDNHADQDVNNTLHEHKID